MFETFTSGLLSIQISNFLYIQSVDRTHVSLSWMSWTMKIQNDLEERNARSKETKEN